MTVRVGEENGAVTCSEQVQADLNGCWYSDFPQELLSGLCWCFRFQREAINAQPVDLIHMYGWLFVLFSYRLPSCLPDCLKACWSPNWFLVSAKHRNRTADMLGTKHKQDGFHKVIIQTMHLDIEQQITGSICSWKNANRLLSFCSVTNRYGLSAHDWLLQCSVKQTSNSIYYWLYHKRGMKMLFSKLSNCASIVIWIWFIVQKMFWHFYYQSG